MEKGDFGRRGVVSSKAGEGGKGRQEASKTAPRGRTTPLDCTKSHPQIFNIANIAEIDESKSPFHKAPNDKGGRAAVVPLGEVNKKTK